MLHPLKPFYQEVEKKKPKLEYLPDKFVVADEEIIFTSGKDGIFAAGIPVGKTLKDQDVVKVNLFSDPNQLSFLNIVLISTTTEENF